MRVSAGKLLEVGITLCALAVPGSLAGIGHAGAAEPASLTAPFRLAQNQPAAAAPATIQDQDAPPSPGQPAQGQTLAAPQAGLPAGPLPASQIPSGQVAPGPVPMGQVPMGQIGAGQIGAGQIPAAEAPQSMAGTPLPAGEIPKPIHGSVPLEAGSGKILTLTLPAANIYVADPKVAEVRPASSTSLFVFGVGAGRTTVAAVDALGRLLADYQITVKPSGFGASEAQATIAHLVPGSRIEVKAQGKGVILTGTVANAADAEQAMTIAKGYVSGDGASVGNQMTITSPTQVTLMVRIAEMKRSTARSLGLNWQAVAALGKTQFGLPILSTELISAGCAGATSGNPTQFPIGFRGPCATSMLTALANEGLAHILAEPNLTVMSGQVASFQAGGEYPYAVPGGSANPNSVTIEFKPYGVLLSFVPTVLNSGRINLHVKPEVSQLDSTNVVQLPGGGTVDGLLVRRAETTVELGSGETFAIAGMLQTVDNNNDSGLPGLGDTPIIGALFKTNSMTREQTELVIMVTPLLVHPVRTMAELRIPGEGYKVPGDVDRELLLHQVPNADGSTTPRSSADAGFIVR